jgi:hypothetical protein
VYSALLKTTIDGLKELRELNKTVTDLEIESDKPKITKDGAQTINNTTNNVILTGKDLLSMIKSAKEVNQLNAIEARFDFGDRNNL